MLIKTILNKIEKFSSFVYSKIYFGVRGFKDCIIVEVHHRKKSKGKCPICLRRCSTYDTSQKARLFSYVPLWSYRERYIYYSYRELGNRP